MPSLRSSPTHRAPTGAYTGGLRSALLCSVLLHPSLSHAQTPAAAHIAGTVHVEGGGANDFNHDNTGPYGNTEIGGVNVRFGRDAAGKPTADITVTVRMNINRAALKRKPYTVSDAGVCQGMEFKEIPESWAEAHELEHVQQIRRMADEIIRGTTYDAQHNRYSVTVKSHSGYSSTTSGSPNDATWGAFQDQFKKAVESGADDISKNDQEQYQNQATNKGEERGARDRSCADFMQKLGNDWKRLIEDAVELAEDAQQHVTTGKADIVAATAAANAALKAANAALAAALKCDLEEFKRQYALYTRSKKTADEKLKFAALELGSAREHMVEMRGLLMQYAAAKTAAKVSKFPVKAKGMGGVQASCDATAEKLDKLDKALSADIDKGEKDMAAAKAILAKAATTMADAFKALLACKDEAAKQYGGDHVKEVLPPGESVNVTPGPTPLPPKVPESPAQPAPKEVRNVVPSPSTSRLPRVDGGVSFGIGLGYARELNKGAPSGSLAMQLEVLKQLEKSLGVGVLVGYYSLGGIDFQTVAALAAERATNPSGLITRTVNYSVVPIVAEGRYHLPQSGGVQLNAYGGLGAYLRRASGIGSSSTTRMGLHLGLGLGLPARSTGSSRSLLDNAGLEARLHLISNAGGGNSRVLTLLGTVHFP